MIPLPRWVWPYLLLTPCPVCNSATKLENVEAVGVKQKHPGQQKLEKGNAVLIFEYCCSTCKQRTHWSADPDDPNASAEDVASSIFEALQKFAGKKTASSNIKVSKSQISNKEFDSFKKKLRETNTHKDFLALIGIPPEQIEKLSKDKKQHGDPNK